MGAVVWRVLFWRVEGSVLVEGSEEGSFCQG